MILMWMMFVLHTITLSRYVNKITETYKTLPAKAGSAFPDCANGNEWFPQQWLQQSQQKRVVLDIPSESERHWIRNWGLIPNSILLLFIHSQTWEMSLSRRGHPSLLGNVTSQKVHFFDAVTCRKRSLFKKVDFSTFSCVDLRRAYLRGRGG